MTQQVPPRASCAVAPLALSCSRAMNALVTSAPPNTRASR
jgi:hypothetical protein